MPPAKKYTEAEVQKLLADGLSPAWRHGFAQGLETAAAVTQEVMDDPDITPEGAGTAAGIHQALMEAHQAVLEETPATGADGTPTE